MLHLVLEGANIIATLLKRKRGWSEKRYRNWLLDALSPQLLGGDIRMTLSDPAPTDNEHRIARHDRVASAAGVQMFVAEELTYGVRAGLL